MVMLKYPVAQVIVPSSATVVAVAAVGELEMYPTGGGPATHVCAEAPGRLPSPSSNASRWPSLMLLRAGWQLRYDDRQQPARAREQRPRHSIVVQSDGDEYT